MHALARRSMAIEAVAFSLSESCHFFSWMSAFEKLNLGSTFFMFTIFGNFDRFSEKVGNLENQSYDHFSA
jgi:hypothetical protein